MRATVQAGQESPYQAAPRIGRAEVVLALAAFAVLCIVALRTAPQLVEPDDYAYRASIVGITDGHLLTLSTAQMHALAAQLAPTPGHGNAFVGGPLPHLLPIQQWSHLANGRWISEKDPGYPFLAAPFQLLGIIRLAPLFYGALACLGLFAGARRWLGRYGGATAGGVFCSSGAALLFAWRDYMPTFTDASLIAAGSGALLWAVLADSSTRLRTAVGLLGFAAIEAAVFTRYSNIVVLACAVLAVLILRWRRPGQLPDRAVTWWIGSAVLFCAGVAVFDTLVYGGPLASGYEPGEIRFGMGAVWPNLRLMPSHLIEAMPMLVLGFAAVIGVGARWIRSRRSDAPPATLPEPGGTEGPGRDAAIGLALGASWLCAWGLYAAYEWTAAPGLSTLQSVRFYLPAIGPIALLGAWTLTRLPLRRGLAVATSVAVVA
ncbi:MAG: hypothetical protein ACTHKL_28390, partial [Streptosporangiaceae bacterium]